MNNENKSLTESQEEAVLICQAARKNLLTFSQCVDKTYIANWHHYLIAKKLEEVFARVQKGEKVRLMINLPPRAGKQIANSTPVLTPVGWKNHGDLHVGDIVFSHEGKQIKVEAESEETFSDVLVHFSDGSIIQTHENHEWVVFDRKKQKERVIETKEMLNSNLSVEGEQGKRGHRFRFNVDSNVGVDLDEKKLPIDPYFLGVWLGDGKSSAGEFCGDKNDVAIVDKLRSKGYVETNIYKHKITGVVHYHYKGMITRLRQLGLYNNKHIPQEYLLGSKEQRLELLAGLIDTDGRCDKRSRYSFSTCSKTLAENVRDLAVSLGSRVYIVEARPRLSTSGIQGKQVVYKVCFNTKENIPVALERKRNKHTNHIRRRRSVIKIEKIQTKERGKCIQVEGGVYLVGKNLIPTHNSRLATQLFPAWALGNKPELEFMVTSYSADLASKFGLATKDLMNNEKYQAIFPNVRLRKDSKSKADWKVKQGGSYHAVGVGGSLTGMGAHCFPAGTLVDTEKGKIAIDDLCHLQEKPRVLSYNHEENILEYKRIRAVAKQSKAGTVVLTTAGGTRIEATPDHPIYVVGKGYVQAQSIAPGQQVIRLQPDEDQARRFKMYTVWKRIYEGVGRVFQKPAQGFSGFLLFDRARKTSSLIQKPSQVCDVRETNTKEDNEILLKGVSTITEKIARYRMFMVQQKDKAVVAYHQILFNVLQKRIPCTAAYGYSQPQLQTRYGNEYLSENVLQSETQDHSERRGVCNLWDKVKSVCTSQRLQPKEQYPREPHNCLCTTPHDTPQVKSDTISSVTLINSDDQVVYDIQVEDNENFFAEDILVHNCAIIDDPIKNREEAESKLMRDKVYDWYTSTLYTRLQGHGAVIVILTRWHDDDLAGKLLYEDEQRRERGEQTEDWEVLKFPAFATHDEDWGEGIIRKEGDVLWPRFFDKQKMLDTKDMVGLYDWAALYQQNPVLAETQEFKEDMFRYFTDDDIKDKQLQYYTMVDPAISQKESADNTVVLTVGKDRNGPNWYRIREDAGHFTPGQTVDLIFKHQQMYRSEVWLETVAYQKALKYSVEEEQRKRQIYFKVEEVKSSGKKEFRIRGLIPLYERGVIYHRKTDKEYELELLTFPRGRRDDRCDAMGMALDAVKNTRYERKVKIKIPEWIGYGKLRRK